MSTISDKVTKVIDITHIGDNSVIGGIIKEHGISAYDKCYDFLWVILCDFNDVDMIVEECEELNIVYIITDRLKMRTNI